MGISSSISAALDAVTRNPVLFVAAFLVSLVSTVLLGVQLGVATGVPAFVWSLASLLVQFVALFFVGGAYAMATEALDGETTFRTLVSGGTDNYVSLLGATLLLVAVAMAAFVAVGFVAVLLFVGAAVSLTGGATVAAFAVVAVIYLLGLVPMFFLQFYGPAVVVSDEGAVDSLKRSFGVVRRNLLATLGFDAVTIALGLLASAPTVWLYATRFDELFTQTGGFTPLAGLTPTMTAGYLVSTLVLSTLFGGFFYTYQVAFYEDRLAEATFDRDSSVVGDLD